ncbi:hypothetical protein [Paracoccus onubensis]|nr:hypothetical protein [Paracoccus onubensis]
MKKFFRGRVAHAIPWILGGTVIVIIWLDWWFGWGIPMGHGPDFGYR